MMVVRDVTSAAVASSSISKQSNKLQTTITPFQKVLEQEESKAATVTDASSNSKTSTNTASGVSSSGAASESSAVNDTDTSSADSTTLKDLFKKASKKYNIKLVVFLSWLLPNIGERAKELADLGVEYFFILRRAGENRETDALADVKANVPNNIFVGVTSDDMDELKDSVKNGADWIIFGVALKQADAVICQEWVDAIHNGR